MGTRGSAKKIQSIRFPQWMADAIEKVAMQGNHTFTDVVLDLLRQALGRMGYTMGIGWEMKDNHITPDNPIVIKDPSPEYKPIPELEWVELPLYGETAAGEPLNINSSPEGTWPCSRHLVPGNLAGYFALKIKGYSMTESGITDGDVVIIRAVDVPEEGKIMLVRYEDKSTLKRLKKINGKWLLCW